MLSKKLQGFDDYDEIKRELQIMKVKKTWSRTTIYVY